MANGGTRHLADRLCLCQLAINRHLQDVGAGPKLPGTDDDSESAPG
jgi:hypothetical protein